MSRVDVTRPINRHLEMAHAKLDDLIEELTCDPAELSARRAQRADQLFQFGRAFAELSKSLRHMAEQFNAGVRSVK